MGAEIDVLQACARAILLLPTGSASQVTGAGCRVRRRVATRSTPSPSRRPAGFSAASSDFVAHIDDPPGPQMGIEGHLDHRLPVVDEFLGQQ